MRVHHSRSRTVAQLPWPIVSIDFEASSLAADSYPIKVGIARWRAPDLPIERWSTLIRPPEAWRRRSWSEQSEALHGIRREQLDEGMSPKDAMLRLNRLCGRQAFCDGGQHDLRWLGGVEYEADVDATFLLRDADALGGPLHRRRWRRMHRWLEASPPRHRAADDAERPIKALAVGLACRYGEVVDLDQLTADGAAA